MAERCTICGCRLHREGDYARPTVRGRSHATEHHFVAERFFGRSGNRPGTTREAIFKQCPWEAEGKKGVFCYECHEDLLHNPVLLPEDVSHFAQLVRLRGLHEKEKDDSRKKLAGRILLFHEVISAGLRALQSQTR